MVIISNNQIDAESFGREYPPNGIERTIINQLCSSNEKYYYDSLEQFRFELKLRNEIIKSSVDLNKSYFDFAVFRKTKCNEKYWKRTNEGGFILRNDVNPSDAIRDIYLNGNYYATECATAMVIVYYKALLNIYGDKLFNELFPKIHLMNWHYLDRLLKEVGYTRNEKDFLPGDRRYFANPDVSPITPEWQGENVIDLNNALYYGHGIGIQKADVIINELNNNRKPGSQVSAHLLQSAGRPNFKNLSDIYYKSVSQVSA